MVGIIDETFRDGPQSLWATRMRTATMLGGAAFADAAKFHRICVTSGAAFETAVRFLGDDPWDRLRALRAAMPNSSLEVLVRSRNLFGWDQYADDVVELMFARMRACGIDWLKIFDGLNDFDNIAAHFSIAKRLGFKVAGMITYSASPVHTNEYFADKARELLRHDVDTVMFCDASGLMTGEQTRTVLAAILHALGGAAPLEFYAHHSMGLAHESYRAAMQAGVLNVTTASRPLANGESVPAALDIAAIAREGGVSMDIDTDAVRKLDEYFSFAARQEKQPVHEPVRFDKCAYDFFAGHQIPGGMISNFRNQLRELGLIHRMNEVLEEAARVRAELGYPVMVTPFSQFVGVQATLNIIQGERYKTIPDGVAAYVAGQYGKSPAQMDGDVVRRIAEGRQLRPVDLVAQFTRPTLEAFRSAKGPFASDEDLLLHLFYGADHVAALRKQQAARGRPEAAVSPLGALVGELAKLDGLRRLQIQKGDLDLRLNFDQGVRA